MPFNMLALSPYPWMLLSSFFLGLALNTLTRSVRKAPEPEKARNRKRTAVYLLVSVSLVFFICAVFIPGSEKMSTVSPYVFFAVCAGIFFLAFRFKKLFGIPFTVLLVLFVGAMLLFIQALVSFTGETEIAELRVLSTDNNEIVFEFILPGRLPQKMTMPGRYLGAEVKEIIFDDFLVFFGARTWYRFVGLKSAEVKKGSEMTEELGAYELKRPEGLPESMYTLLAGQEPLIPGIKAIQVQVTYVQVRPLTTYSVRIQHDSGVEIPVVSWKRD